jgi:VWFA-related protein
MMRMSTTRVTKLMFFAAIFSCLATYLNAQAVDDVPTATILISPESDLRNLTPQNLLVSVGKSEFVPVKEIKSAKSVPLDVILLIDTSNSMRDGGIVNDALLNATRLIDSASKSGIPVRYAAIQVGNVPKLVQGFTSEPITSRSIHLSPGGGTALFDAFALAGEMFQKEPASTRHIVLVFTDGGDNQSRQTRREASEALSRGSAVVYAIDTRVNKPLGFETREEEDLKFMSEQTGGRIFSPGRKSKVPEVFAQIENDLQQQLILTFSHSNSSRELERIRFRSTIKGVRFRAPQFLKLSSGSFN